MQWQKLNILDTMQYVIALSFVGTVIYIFILIALNIRYAGTLW